MTEGLGKFLIALAVMPLIFVVLSLCAGIALILPLVALLFPSVIKIND
jgi:hypothetical protein